MFKQHYPTILLLDYYEKVDEKSFFIRVIFKEAGVGVCITVRMPPTAKLVFKGKIGPGLLLEF